MKNATQSFINELKKDNRNYLKSAVIKLKSGRLLTIDNSKLWSNGLSVDTQSSSSDNFDIGSVIVDKLTVVLNNITGEYDECDFTDATISNVRVGLKLEDGTTEYIKYGAYNLSTQTYNGSIITLVFLDNMIKFDKPYHTTLVFPATVGAIVRDCCLRCGVTLLNQAFSNSTFLITKKPTGDNITYRQVLAWCMQVTCNYAQADEDGKLHVKWYDVATLESIDLTSETPEYPSNYHHLKSFSVSPDISLDDVVVTGIKVTVDENSSDSDPVSALVGSEGYVLEISDNPLIDASQVNTVASMIAEKVVGLRFRAFNATHLSNPLIESGDIAVITNRKGDKYKTVITSNVFTPGDYQTLSCGARTPSRQSATMYSKQANTYTLLRQQIQQERSAREAAFESLSAMIGQSDGVFTTEEITDSGAKIFYLHDKPTLDASTMVWRMSAEAFSVANSKDVDGNWIWNAGVTVNGEVIARILSVEHINADWIQSGALNVTNTVTGETIFQADITNGSVTLSGDFVTIGDKTLPEQIQAMMDKIDQNATLTATLSNEYQSIPTKTDGSYTQFPDVSTTIQVFYGQQDVTDSCLISPTTSAGVSGSYNSATKTYTVTGLSTDTGWVDFAISYLNTITVVRRFSISKQKQGESATIKYIKTDAPLTISRDKNGLSPNVINLQSMQKISDTEESFQGYFIVKYTNDGSTWNTVYAGYESELTYLVDGVFDLDFYYLCDGDDHLLGIASEDLKQIQVTLKESATGATYDVVTFSVITEATALTSEDIVNLLTDDGRLKGIYKVGNQLYFSFDYALGGTLTLGGANNGNGKLRILDENGNEIGYIDHTGVNFQRGSFTGVVESEEGRIGGWIIRDGKIYYEKEETANTTTRFEMDSSKGEISGYLGEEKRASFTASKLFHANVDFTGTGKIGYGSGYSSLRWDAEGFDGSGGFGDLYFTGLSTQSSGTDLILGSDGKTIYRKSSSSRRYKNHVGELTLEEASALYDIPVVWFEYKDGYLSSDDYMLNKPFPGFYAEDTQQYLPEAVTKYRHRIDKDNNATKEWIPEDWEPKNMIPLMVKLIQEQKKQIDRLTQRIETLEGGQ